MCLSPLRIPNNKSSKDFNRFVDRLYNTVPCGKCEECCNQIASAYETRSIAEFNYTTSIGGQTYFYTLTYNENEVPKYHDVMCFCGRDLTRFYKLLRMRLANHNIYLKSFVSSEYGENGTLRPHYHLLLHLSKSINGKLLRKYITESWVRFVGRGRYQKSISLGFNKPGVLDGDIDTIYGLVKDIRPCKYVAKYVSKDISQISHFVHANLTNDIIETSKEDDEFKRQKFSFLPIHRTSIGYGVSLLDYLEDDDFINGTFYFPLDRKKDGSFVSHIIPLYIKRKKLYNQCCNYAQNIVYRLNDYGMMIKKAQLKSQIDDCVSRYITFECINNQIDYKPFNLSVDYVKCLFTTINPRDLFEYVYLYKSLLFNNYYRYDNVDRFLKQYYEFYLYPERYKLIYTTKDEIINPLYDFVYCLYLYSLSNLKFNAYVENKISYNQEQYYRSLETGKFKPVYIKTFREYLDVTNILFNNLPLLTRFKRIKNNVNHIIKEMDLFCSNLFEKLKKCLQKPNLPPWLLGENDLSKMVLDVCPF